MIDVLDTIKQAYDKSTTQVDKIILNGKEYRISNVEYYDDTYLDGNIFGTAIGKNIDFEIENTIDLEGQEIEYLTGITTNGTTHWISLGKFIIQDVQSNNTTNIAKVTATDYMLKTNIPYVSDLDYGSGKVTLLNVLQEVCTKSNLILATTSFPNSTFIVDSNQFTDGALNRQVIQAVAQISGTVAKIRNNKLYLINPSTITTVSKVFTLNSYKEAEIKRATHPINLVSLGITDVEGENITLRDETSITKNGENSLVINDNPFAYTQAKREQLITALFNAVKGFEYKSYSFKNCQGLPYLETLDKIQFKDKEGNTYDSFIFRFNNKSPNGLESTIEAPSITKATVTYQNVPSALDIAKRTEFIVNKQEQKITLLSEQTDSITKTKTTKEGTTIEIDDSAEEPILELEVDGKSEQETRSGKNYFNANNIKNTNIIVENNGQKLMMPIDTSGNGYTTTNTLLKDLCPNLKVGDTVYINAKSTANEANRLVYLSVPVSENWNFGTQKTITEEMLNTSLILYGNRYTSGDTEQVIITDLMITKENDSEWEQYGAMPSPEFPSEIQSVGDDVNLFDGELELGDINVSGNLDTITNRIRSKNYNIISPNEEYIIFSPDIDIRDDYTQVFFYDENKTYISNVWKAKFTTPSNAKYYRFKNLETTDITIKVKLQKGTVATAYSEYGKGTVEIKQCGKNLLNVPQTYEVNHVNISVPLELPAGEYIVSAEKSESNSSTDWSSLIIFYYEDETQVGIYLGGFNPNISNLRLAKPIKRFNIYSNVDYASSRDVTTIFTNLMIREKDTDETYEPYFANNYVIPLSQPLRSLPNGVCDTIEEDGIHRRVGTVILDGSDDETYGIAGEGNTTDGFSMYTTFAINNIKSVATKSLRSNYFQFIERAKVNSSSMNFITGGGATSIVLNIDRSLLETEDIAGFKKWLQQNPIQVDYELAEEIIEPLTEEQQTVIDSIKTNLYKQYFTSDANMRITYVRNNGLSDMYETKDSASRNYTETEKKIGELNVSIDGISARASELKTRLDDEYMTTEEVESAIDIKAGEINSEVSKKVGDDEIISKINQSAEEVQIDADKVSLVGKKLNLTGDNIEIKSDNFSVDKEGNVSAKSGTVGGYSLAENYLYSEIYPFYDYVDEDVQKVIDYIMGTITLTDEEKIKYDINEDGKITAVDVMLMRQLIKANVTTTEHGTIQIQKRDPIKTIVLRDKDDEIKTRIGLLGIVTNNLSVNGVSFGETVEWTDLEYTNGFSAGTAEQLQYSVNNGFVTIRGGATGTFTAGDYISINENGLIPEEYRPSQKIRTGACGSGARPCIAEIGTDGRIKLGFNGITGTPSWIAFSVTYPIEHT